MDPADATDVARSRRHRRFVATARRLRADGDPQQLLRTVADGLLRLAAEDHLSLHLAAGDVLQVVAQLPHEATRAASAAAAEAVRTNELVRTSGLSGEEVAVPVVLEDRGRGALVLRRPEARPDPDDELLELAAVLLGSAVATTRWLEGQRDLDRARANFVARISHELRTPLTIISGFATTLGAQDDELSVEQRHGMLDRIVTASVRLEHLVEEVLTLASVDVGHTAPHPVSCSVRDVLDLVINDQGGGESCTVDCAHDLHAVTDPIVARLVLGPIVENALQHGDRVELVARRVAAGVRVTVTDDGPGIPVELGDAIFERFVRGDDRAPGFGLGLSTAREVGAAIGAELALVERGGGTSIEVLLPDLEDDGRRTATRP
ncbi:MAG: HAMP domain-containing sensor histidine kinase [Nitriliruptor sp.]